MPISSKTVCLLAVAGAAFAAARPASAQRPVAMCGYSHWNAATDTSTTDYAPCPVDKVDKNFDDKLSALAAAMRARMTALASPVVLKAAGDLALARLEQLKRDFRKDFASPNAEKSPSEVAATLAADGSYTLQLIVYKVENGRSTFLGKASDSKLSAVGGFLSGDSDWCYDKTRTEWDDVRYRVTRTGSLANDVHQDAFQELGRTHGAHDNPRSYNGARCSRGHGYR